MFKSQNNNQIKLTPIKKNATRKKKKRKQYYGIIGDCIDFSKSDIYALSTRKVNKITKFQKYQINTFTDKTLTIVHIAT